MAFYFAEHTEAKEWNRHILASPNGGNILQASEFAEQKKSDGWTPRFIMADTLAITVLEKSIVGFGKLWYIPKGPSIISTRELDAILPELRDFAAKNNVFLVKMEPELEAQNETRADLLKLGLIKTRPIQPNWSTIYVDLHDSLDEIMKKLPQKGRHAIRRAQRDGVTVKQVRATDKNCLVMYSLLKDTAADAQFGIRSSNYYKTFYQRFEQAGQGQLFFAYFEGEIVAGAFAMVFGKKSTYKDGASIRKRTAYGASHLLQWHVIKWAKEKGALIHDLCGAPPINESKNPHHPHYGIGLFKTSFNKEITEYVGAYDIPVHPLKYKLWTHFLEKIVRRIHYKLYETLY
jgi:lipid II:glycine glycyltransferase (peptidoglycan interpeptide bridge formation enzyme)